MSFFGTELAKAVPFVDWAEIYQVQGNAPIRMNENTVGAAQHVVFATRVLVDLVLLAAFLQAISISQRTSKLKDMFYQERTLDRLDPFIEPGELRKLVRPTLHGFELIRPAFEDFPVYDPDRLEELALRGENDDIGFVALRLSERDEALPPEDQFLGESKRELPNHDKLEGLIDELRNRPDVAVGPLKAAHYRLNNKTEFWTIRRLIAEIIAQQNTHEVAINALAEILIGPGPGVMDPRREVREVALAALYLPAMSGNKVARASIRHAAKHDGAAQIRNAAQRTIDTQPDWT